MFVDKFLLRFCVAGSEKNRSGSGTPQSRRKNKFDTASYENSAVRFLPMTSSLTAQVRHHRHSSKIKKIYAWKGHHNSSSQMPQIWVHSEIEHGTRFNQENRNIK